MNLYQPGLDVFSERLNDIADFQEGLLFFQTLMLIARSRATYKE